MCWAQFAERGDPVGDLNRVVEVRDDNGLPTLIEAVDAIAVNTVNASRHPHEVGSPNPIKAPLLSDARQFDESGDGLLTRERGYEFKTHLPSNESIESSGTGVGAEHKISVTTSEVHTFLNTETSVITTVACHVLDAHPAEMDVSNAVYKSG